ncbi:hypothetical protein NC652_015159 [Populus alba x Populus x berolinensis]|nr:hypothetical protein NC652_015159 [Populus alba x Populus x berolinensis]
MDSEGLCKDLDCLLSESLEKLNAAKKELAARLRAVMSVKRKLGEVPTQSELIQFMNVGFKTVKDHNQDAITTTNGCTKLIASMEGIVKGSQQRLQLRSNLGLQEVQKVSDALKKRLAAGHGRAKALLFALEGFSG